MTERSVRANIADELRLADSALDAASALLDLGLVPDAASRTYYAAFHAARALLFSLGLEPRSHRALRTLVSQHFVRTGRLHSGAAKDLAQLEALRHEGDYDPAVAFAADDVHPELEPARAFVAEAKRLLFADGGEERA